MNDNTTDVSRPVQGERTTRGSARDRLERDIQDRLQEGDFDPEVFETAVVELLSREIPGLVPVSGGSDQGWDGEAFDEETGELYPLIVTKAKRPEGNLRRSLQRIAQSQPALPSRAIFVTSRRLTQESRLELRQLAAGEGVDTLQIFDQEALVQRFYRSPEWCQKLLSIAGNPPALSGFPETTRPFLDLPLVGRDADLEWLRRGLGKGEAGDRLLVGEPGSGKTFLGRQLVVEGRALFLVDDDRKKIVDDLRRRESEEAKPEAELEIVIVDDAHAFPERLRKLRHLRQELGSRFSILALSWFGERDRVMEKLGLPEDRVRRLELLNRKETLDLLQAAGVSHPNHAWEQDILEMLRSSSGHKPGLAATLADLWLKGAYKEVMDGRALKRVLVAPLHAMVGDDPTTYLACVALAGDAGIDPKRVDEFLGLNRQEGARYRRTIGASGLLREREDRRWSLWPPPLRVALVREVFLPPPGEAALVELSDWWAQVVNGKSETIDHVLARETTTVLAAARLHGAPVDDDLLRDRVVRFGSDDSWACLIRSSEANARWVLEEHPEQFETRVQDFLDVVPSEAVRTLLARVEAAEERPNQAHYPLQMWVNKVRDVGRTIEHRRLVLDAVEEYLDQGGEEKVAALAGLQMIDPVISDLEPSAQGATIYSGVVPDSYLPGLVSLWEPVRRVLQRLDVDSIDDELWSLLDETVRHWINPSESTMGATQTSAEHLRPFAEAAARMIEDLVPIVAASPALSQWLGETIRGFEEEHEIAIDRGLETDSRYELLFPSWQTMHDEFDEEGEQKARTEGLGALAAEWVQQEPEEIASKLAWYLGEAARSQSRDDSNVVELCRRLAERSDDPERWGEIFARRRMDARFVAPFLATAVERRRAGWEELGRRLLRGERYSELAFLVLFPIEDFPDEALKRAVPASTLIHQLIRENSAGLERYRLLLTHDDRSVAITTAMAIAYHGLQEIEQLEQEVRQAILRIDPDQAIDAHLLEAVFARYPDLAQLWIETNKDYFARPDEFLLSVAMLPKPVRVALETLTIPQRVGFARSLEFSSGMIAPIAALVDGAPEVYRALLERGDLNSDQKRVSLEGVPDAAWADLAEVALEHFDGLDSIVEATIPSVQVWSGEEAHHLTRYLEGFRSLRTDPRPEIQRLARRGVELLEERIETVRASEAKEERQREIYGF